jgi:hypothetical protein
LPEFVDDEIDLLHGVTLVDEPALLLLRLEELPHQALQCELTASLLPQRPFILFELLLVLDPHPLEHQCGHVFGLADGFPLRGEFVPGGLPQQLLGVRLRLALILFHIN